MSVDIAVVDRAKNNLIKLLNRKIEIYNEVPENKDRNKFKLKQKNGIIKLNKILA